MNCLIIILCHNFMQHMHAETRNNVFEYNSMTAKFKLVHLEIDGGEMY